MSFKFEFEGNYERTFKKMKMHNTYVKKNACHIVSLNIINCLPTADMITHNCVQVNIRSKF